MVLLSPDAEYLLVLTFSVRGEQFEELKPLLTEVVRRVQWADDHREAEPGVGPVLITNRTMYVHNEPASFSPVIGKIVAGKQFSIMERDFTGKWWRISYGGQPGWVSDRLVAANIPDAPPSGSCGDDRQARQCAQRSKRQQPGNPRGRYPASSF